MKLIALIKSIPKNKFCILLDRVIGEQKIRVASARAIELINI